MELKDVPIEMQKRIQIMMGRTWDIIGSDVLEACEIAETSGGSIRRSEVIEMVCDAGRMKMYGNDDVAYDIFNQLSSGARNAISKIAFPYKTYGY